MLSDDIWADSKISLLGHSPNGLIYGSCYCKKLMKLFPGGNLNLNLFPGRCSWLQINPFSL